MNKHCCFNPISQQFEQEEPFVALTRKERCSFYQQISVNEDE